MSAKFLATEFEALRKAAFPDAGEQQVRDMRWCFIAGAHAIVNKLPEYLDAGIKETGRDLLIMEGISKEIDECQAEITAACPTAGRA